MGRKPAAEMEDWYAKSSLVTREERDNNGYKAIDLKDIRQIIAEGREGEIFEEEKKACYIVELTLISIIAV